MRAVRLDDPADLGAWRAAARSLALAGVPPEGVEWQVGAQAGLFGEGPPTRVAGGLAVPKGFLDLAETVVCHRDGERFALLYRLLWRLVRGERHLLEIASDPDVRRADAMARSVRRDVHKMHAFVRFKERDGRYLAWFEPDHHVVERAAPFFARRFANMDWSILTPGRSAHWDGESLSFGPGGERGAVPEADPLEEHWRSYYASIFNPARLKVAAMRSEMPRKYWRNLPEARLIRPLVRDAARRAASMVAEAPAAPAPKSARWACGGRAEPKALEACRRCDLWRSATQAVPGEGPMDARLMLVGEQPGDQEDLAGRPFVGPAGRLLDRALAEAGIDRSRSYLTNAVKHFKFELRGKRRIHKRPDAGEVERCRWWLEEEVRAIRPAVLVALGATAGRALLGREVSVLRERGVVTPLGDGASLVLTVHPSYLLRLPDEAARRAEWGRFVADLSLAAGVLGPA